MKVIVHVIRWAGRARGRGRRPGAVRRAGRGLALRAAAVLFGVFGVRALIALFAAHSAGERWLYGGVLTLMVVAAASSWFRADRVREGRA